LRELVLATGNRAKAREFAQLLRPYVSSLRVLGDLHPGVEIEESGSTFRENALIKARTALSLTGLPSLADDSGLEVAALGGRPGVQSARYAGGGGDEANIEKLLREMEGVADRRARFVCCIALAYPDGSVVVVEGTCSGLIAERPRGEHGFGYDPVFYLPERGATMAELPPHEKNAVSHRARAVKALTMYLEGLKRRA